MIRHARILFLLLAIALTACSKASPDAKSAPGANGKPELTPLMSAAQEGDADALRRLLEGDGAAMINEVNERTHQTALTYAISSKNKEARTELVRLLLDAGADPNLIGPNSTPPLSLSIAEGENQIFELLMNRRADIEIGDWDRSTPLMYAAANGQRGMVDALLNAGADIRKQDQMTFYPIDHALIMGLSDMAEYLRSKNGKSVMDTVKTAADARQLMKTAEVEETQDFLYFQVVYNNLLITKLMLMAGYTLDDRMNEMIYDLAKMNHLEMLRLLLEAGADPDEEDETTGTTALMNAAKHGHAEVVSLLLGHQADPLIRDHQGMTALDYAEEMRDQAVIALLQPSDRNPAENGIATNRDPAASLISLYREATQGKFGGIEYGVASDKDVIAGMGRAGSKGRPYLSL